MGDCYLMESGTGSARRKHLARPGGGHREHASARYIYIYIHIYMYLSEFESCTWERPRARRQLRLYRSWSPPLTVGRPLSIHHRDCLYKQKCVRYQNQSKHLHQKNHNNHYQNHHPTQTHGQHHHHIQQDWHSAWPE